MLYIKEKLGRAQKVSKYLKSHSNRWIHVIKKLAHKNNFT